MLAPVESSGANNKRARCAASPRAAPWCPLREFGLQAMSCGFVTARPNRSSANGYSRHVKRGGKLYVPRFSG